MPDYVDDVLPDFDLYDEGPKRRIRKVKPPMSFRTKVVLITIGLLVAMTPLILVFGLFNQMLQAHR